jgi:hypothetical protein
VWGRKSIRSRPAGPGGGTAGEGGLSCHGNREVMGYYHHGHWGTTPSEVIGTLVVIIMTRALTQFRSHGGAWQGQRPALYLVMLLTKRVLGLSRLLAEPLGLFDQMIGLAQQLRRLLPLATGGRGRDGGFALG